MSHLRILAGNALGAALLCFSTSGCFFVSSDPEPQPVVDPSPTYPVGQGTLVVDWTIDGAADSAKCSQSGSSKISIAIYRSDRSPAGTYVQDCGAFATSIPLDADDYAASAVLLDASSQPRTTTIEIRPFTILGNDRLAVPVDFPADSFFQQF